MSRHRALARLITEQSGGVLLEYSLTLGLVSVGATLAIVELGPQLLHLFQFQETLLLLPFP